MRPDRQCARSHPDIADWLEAGAVGFGFGFGSELFRPEYSLEEIERRARQIVGTFRAAHEKIMTAAGGTVLDQHRL